LFTGTFIPCARKRYTSHTWRWPASPGFEKYPDFEMTSVKSPTLSSRIERWPIKGAFTISRGAKFEAVTVVAEIALGDHIGRGECLPYARYGETPDGALAALLAMQDAVARGLERCALQAEMPPCAARNALDCALLDLEAKRSGKRAWDLLKPPAEGRDDRLYDLAGVAAGHGSGHCRGRPPPALEDQAWWR
jgi:L-alanine-DL-glutamate epimerase-like enolase superfamily enzyme